MAKVAADIIKEAVEKAREDWLDYTIVQERKIYTMFSEASNNLTMQIAKYTSEGVIPPLRLRILLNKVKSEMDAIRPRLGGLIKRSKSNSINYGLISSVQGANVAMLSKFKVGIGTSFIGKDGKVYRFDPKIEKYADSVWARINGQAMDALIRTNYGGITISKRIWDITWSVEKKIRDQINLAVLTGKSSTKVTRQIRSYLGLPDTFRGVVLKEFHPGAGIYKSSYKNALRLTTTEMNRAYVEGMFRYSKMKKWITGWIWRTGSGNPCEECLDEEGTFYPKDNPPNIPLHPFCYCYPEIQYKGD